MEVISVGLSDFLFDSSNCPDSFYRPNINQSIERLISAGFRLICETWEDAWGQGDGHWRKCTLERGDIRFETTSDSRFNIFLLDNGEKIWKPIILLDE